VGGKRNQLTFLTETSQNRPYEKTKKALNPFLGSLFSRVRPRRIRSLGRPPELPGNEKDEPTQLPPPSGAAPECTRGAALCGEATETRELRDRAIGHRCGGARQNSFMHRPAPYLFENPAATENFREVEPHHSPPCGLTTAPSRRRVQVPKFNLGLSVNDRQNPLPPRTGVKNHGT
jgi:hypothetical protein